MQVKRKGRIAADSLPDGNVHLAAEFHVLSLLHRLGVEAYLTHGNAKKIDILVRHGKRNITTDAKGTQDKKGQSWLPTELHADDRNHFYVIVHYKELRNLDTLPDIYIIPATDMKAPLVYNPPKYPWKNQLHMTRAMEIDYIQKYKNAWWRILGNNDAAPIATPSAD